MGKQFRALRWMAGVYRALAWIGFGGGLLLAVLAIALGLLRARGGPSAWWSSASLLPWAADPLSGLLLGVGLLLAALVHFLLAYAAADLITLALSIERHSRETAAYLRGEGEMPPAPQPIAWDTPLPPAPSS